MNKTKYFKLHLNNKVSLERPKGDLRLTWDWPGTGTCYRMHSECSRMFQNVPECSRMFQNVPECMQFHELVCRSIWLHTDAWACLQFHELICSSFFVWAAHKNFAVLVEQIKHKTKNFSAFSILNAINNMYFDCCVNIWFSEIKLCQLCSTSSSCCVNIHKQSILVATFDQSKIKTVASASQSLNHLVLQNTKK